MSQPYGRIDTSSVNMVLDVCCPSVVAEKEHAVTFTAAHSLRTRVFFYDGIDRTSSRIPSQLVFLPSLQRDAPTAHLTTWLNMPYFHIVIYHE